MLTRAREGPWTSSAFATRLGAAVVVNALLVVGGLLPLATMLASLFAAVWIRT
jgi:hypothetical protein